MSSTKFDRRNFIYDRGGWSETVACYASFLGPVWCTHSVILRTKRGSAKYT